MAAVIARTPELPARTATPPPHLTLNTSIQGSPAAIPNKHIPFCSPGPQPTSGLLSPPASPPKDAKVQTPSILYPPDPNTRINESPPVYAISASVLAEALEFQATTPIPDPKHVFPWFHGLHAENHMQLTFFVARRRALRAIPQCLRGLTLVKAGGDLNSAKLKGSVSPEELLMPMSRHSDEPSFIDIDPKIGFSVRNFQIQTCKMATVSDIVVYGDDSTPRDEVEHLGQLFAKAQRAWREQVDPIGSQDEKFNTFVVTDPFVTFEVNHPELVAADSKGVMSGGVMDFFHQERIEMCALSKASEIAPNVYLGPTPDPSVYGMRDHETQAGQYDLLIEASDFARMPDPHTLAEVENLFKEDTSNGVTAHMDFPSSGSLVAQTCRDDEIDNLMAMCHWIHKLATKGVDKKDGSNSTSKPKRILIHCTDGYTETSLLGLCYFMFSERIPAHEAWVRLHREKGRNFFAYQMDKNLLECLESHIMAESPARKYELMEYDQPQWMQKMDGSLPSRILPYLYLGNLNHANNPGLLRELGITRILSVGEPITWREEDPGTWGEENFMFIDKVQDNGVDALTNEFYNCLQFIQGAREAGGATLVHCRVGVSRSATICIAEVMKEMGLSFPRAYCFVRARRLNVIIQPHLRFVYELLKWEEHQRQSRGESPRREMEWASVAREISLMNKPYCRQ